MMREQHYDIVHIHGSSSLLVIELLAAKLSGIKIRIVHSHNTTCNHRILNLIMKPLFNKLSTYRLACGVDAGKWLFGKQDFRVIKNGISLDKFKFNQSVRTEMRNQLGISNKKIVGHVGAFNAQKNHEFLIDVFKELILIDENYVLVLIGDGNKRNDIEKKAVELGVADKIMFLGRRTDIPQLLQAIDIMILPSLYEGLPLVAIEWQAAGLCTIAADTITPEIKLTNLVIFKSLNDTHFEWAETINSMSNQNRIDESRKIRSEGYDINTIADDLISLYYELIGKIV